MQPILVFIALVSALLVFRDARRRNLRHGWAWAVGVFAFWIGVLPVYVWWRKKDGKL